MTDRRETTLGFAHPALKLSGFLNTEDPLGKGPISVTLTILAGPLAVQYMSDVPLILPWYVQIDVPEGLRPDKARPPPVAIRRLTGPGH